MADCGSDAHQHVKSCSFSMHPGAQMMFATIPAMHFLPSHPIIFRLLSWEDNRIQRSSRETPVQICDCLPSEHPGSHPARRGEFCSRHHCFLFIDFVIQEIIFQIENAIEKDLKDLGINIKAGA
jgi:hypothetical protein